MRACYFLLFSLLGSLNMLAQNVNCPPNADFETGTFSNWECFTGRVDTMNGRNVIDLVPSQPTAGRHQMIDFNTSGFDMYGNFPEACPYGGRYSVKLGNNSAQNGAEAITYTFQVPPLADTFSIVYYYAVVFQDPDHTWIEQPRFFVSAYDVETGSVIDCASYDYVATGSIPGFLKSTRDTTVLYKEWTPSSIDFSGYSGRNVRLEFRTADCTRGAHFGYAYLDIGDGCGGELALGAHCANSDSVVLTAPYGFQSYSWYNANYTSMLGNSRLVVLRPAPATSTVFHVDMVPYPGYGCRDTADARVTILPTPDTPSVVHASFCLGDPATPLKAKPNAGHELVWYRTATGGTGSTRTPVPPTNVAGTIDYWVSQRIIFGGCEGPRNKLTVTITPKPTPSFSVNDNQQCLLGNQFVFTNSSTNTLPQATYTWDFGDGSRDSIVNVSHSFSNSGSYWVWMTVHNLGCTRSVGHYIHVIDKPLARFTYPPIICENQTPIVLQNTSYVPGIIGTITNWWWQIDGQISTSRYPPAFTHNAGVLDVKLVVTTSEGCQSDTTHQIIPVYYLPQSKFEIKGSTLCNNEIIQFKDLSSIPDSASGHISNWMWTYDHVPASNQQHPATFLTTGQHLISLQTTSDKGCKSTIMDSLVTVYPKPSVALQISDSCVFRNINYSASTRSSVPVNRWFWNFGFGYHQDNSTITRRYVMEDAYTVILVGESDHQCKDTIFRPQIIYYNRARALMDTMAAMNQPVQLSTLYASNMRSYQWTPSTGLNNPAIANPVAISDRDQTYELNTLTQQGCDSYSKIVVRRFIGPEIYVANAFTPNHDFLNDTLHVFPIGIKTFNYFKIYNRKGQLVFETQNYRIGWDGKFKGEMVEQDNFVWMVSAVDYLGNRLFRKGNVLVLR